jgi:hypothetical protein
VEPILILKHFSQLQNPFPRLLGRRGNTGVRASKRRHELAGFLGELFVIWGFTPSTTAAPQMAAFAALRSNSAQRLRCTRENLHLFFFAVIQRRENE